MNNQITEEYLKENRACEESYDWLRKQKNKDWRVLSQKLYEEKKYDWCLWMLCRKTSIAKMYIWLFIVLCFVLEIGLLVELKHQVNVAMVDFAMSAVGVAVIFAVGTAVGAGLTVAEGLIVAVGTAVAEIAFIAGVTVAFIAGAAVVFVALAAGITIAAIASVAFAAGVAVAFFASVASNSIKKLVCFLCLKEINRC